VGRIEVEEQWFRERARTLTVESCEGDARLHEAICTICRLVAGILQYRFKYLKVVPWNFVHADTPGGAAVGRECW